MGCSDFETRLQHVLDQRLSPDADHLLRQHAGQCEACQSLLHAQRRLFAVRRNSRVTLGPEGEAVSLTGLPGRSRARGSRSPWLVATIAAMLVIALGVLPWMNGAATLESLRIGQRDAAREMEVVLDVAPNQFDEASALETQLVEVEPPRDSIAAWQDLTRTLFNRNILDRNIPEELEASASMSANPELPGGAGTISAASLESATLQTLRTIGASWRPIADSVGHTLTGLRQLLPMPESGKGSTEQPGMSATFGEAHII